MSSENSSPDKIWIITEEISETSPTDEKSTYRGARGSDDTGGYLGAETNEKKIVFDTPTGKKLAITRRPVEVSKLKEEMRGFLQAMREMLDEAETSNSKIQLDEVELSVEINGEGKINLFGIGGGKAGGKGGMTFKFKRK
ncbi:Pepco domain-containing protein [Mastigocoleus testarum]|uniref:Pepco domain-containing protein n=1 Tax=Mastigocoleus testarum BC008 TaxID=371196 RepID=A0A0V7ZCH0_9CYAN|nr:hypothetical protein [Mastigocoleus testarum]KST62217.1 hypothetical protein BC008_37890 [Mastigocoleus testarum BC008]KST64847.1 hypothetical protein BC008_18720 [Mastigocoleus testarum BC008]